MPKAETIGIHSAPWWLAQAAGIHSAHGIAVASAKKSHGRS